MDQTDYDTTSQQTQAYQRALDYLYSFINFEQKPAERYHASKMDMGRTRRLLTFLDEPHTAYPSLHIAGTKGKGSVAMMCANCLRLAGLRVGLYTSPHLREFRERIRVLTPADADGRINESDFTQLIDDVKPHVAHLPHITWFEIVTAVAFLHFARQEVEVAVIEVGLGGRLDATNVLRPLVSVITSLSLDHTALLGDTLEQIAFEKGGIIKPGVPVVVAPQAPEALACLQTLAAQRGSPLTRVGAEWQYAGERQQLTITRSADEAFVPAGATFSLALGGAHQLQNAAVAIAALSQARAHLPQLNLAALREGLATVVWSGRLQMVHNAPGQPRLLVDCAHNPDSAVKLARALQEEYGYERLWLIFGAPSDKGIDEMMRVLFPLAHAIIVSQADHPRAAAPDDLAQRAAALGFVAAVAPRPRDALTLAFREAAPGDLICAAGSIIFVGDLLNQWDDLKSQLT